jgi:2-polyprenyl-3-methyl-5-hydroxy-6-metoxy-1,4-benzoquinol methylase
MSGVRYNYQMKNELKVNQNLWNEWVDINARSKMYDLDAFKKGKNKLDPVVLSEVGSVSGKRLLHLQCHFGMDTLSWARLGADVTGVDFSPKAIDLADSLSCELNIPGRFICCDIYDLPSVLTGQFDIVFATYGVLTWLPDLSRWMAIASQYVKPGGFFYLADGHPFTWIFDEKMETWDIKYPYFQQEPMVCEEEGSYADRTAALQSHTCYQWQHTMGEIITNICENGLSLEFLHEFGHACWSAHPCMREDAQGTWHFPDGDTTLPMMFSLKATKK